MTIAKLISLVGSEPLWKTAVNHDFTRTSNQKYSILLKVLIMTAKTLYLAILLVFIGCQQSGIGQEKSALLSSEAVTDTKLSKQLKINRDTLLKGTSEQIRLDAAAVMLFSDDPLARKILIDVLKQPENKPARAAVCRALSLARSSQEPISQKDDFIEPLVQILTTDDSANAEFAAEATRIFEYEQIAKPLEKILTDHSQPAAARLNAISALKLQPDRRAIFKLNKLLDDPDSEVVSAAEKALISLGIPVVGKDAETRKRIINELERKGTDEFLREWLIRQDDQMRELKTELDQWQNMYLAALDKIYDGIAEDADRGKFLAEHLNNPEPRVKLWALEKVRQRRVGTESKVTAGVDILVGLVSDQNRQVRLKTAKLLSLMGELNSAQKLLEQLKIEQDDEVRTELFVALGGACYYAFLPNSGIDIAPEVRKETLEWAAKFLLDEDPKKAQKGAEVIRKLLEQDGLTAGEVSRYLGLLVESYNRQKGQADGTLRGELLNAMSGLCAQSVHKSESAKLFKPLFEEALRDETNMVREAAVDGLVYIDKARALNILRKDFVNDSSPIIKKKLVDLAGEVGGQDDLVWLGEKLALGNESGLAWQTMLKIFQRSDAAILVKWVTKLGSEAGKQKLSDEQMISLLEIAERKVTTENKADMVKDIRRRLAELYSKSGNFEQAARYFGFLRESATGAEEKEAILAELLGVYFRWGEIGVAAQLVDNCLLEKDLGPDSVIVLLIEDYLNNPLGGTGPEVVLEELSKIQTSEARPMWAKQMENWVERFGGGDASQPGQGQEGG